MHSADDWESHWSRYDVSASRNPAQQMRHAAIARLLRDESRSGSRRILDLGSGQGDLAAVLTRGDDALEFVGFELSSSGVEISRRKVPGATFVLADVLRASADLGRYFGWATHAVCSEVLEHVDCPATFLRSARPFLSDRARLIVTVPGGPMSAFDRSIGHRRHFNRESIASVMRSAGFETERVYRSGFPFFNLYRAIVIARGEKLQRDVQGGQSGFSSRLAPLVMAPFRPLLRLGLRDSPFGWQIVAVARKSA